ncbi:MAG TPA: hypothetical protein VGY48_27230 [Vicinamibacterales bacterium]|nr:hypothetical protein [Vicinamibacterales bacterium]
MTGGYRGAGTVGAVGVVMGGALVWLATAVAAQRPDAFVESRDHPAIQYSTHPVDTSVSRLRRDLEAGRAQLTFEKAGGWLRSLLKSLDIPVESQLLVFSETSAQAPLITMKNPRALYFNDVTAVGWVRGGSVLEIAAEDPREGVIFYTLDQRADARPVLKRNNGCLECHLTWDTLGVPGLTTISTFPMSDDKNAYASGVVVDHRVDLDQRWGGWYITGKSVPARHFGNLPVIRSEKELARPSPPPPMLQSVAGLFDASQYPTPYSDAAAQMVMGHLAHMTNLLTRLGWEARVQSQPTPGKTQNGNRVTGAASDLVDYLLFIDEAPLPRKIEGSSGFAEKFSARGPKDARGRSLYQLDLEHRMMRYPCSFMIYAPAFDALPQPALDAVYRRLWQVLSGDDTSKRYGKLTMADRQAITEILRDTKKSLPPYFRPGGR